MSSKRLSRSGGGNGAAALIKRTYGNNAGLISSGYDVDVHDGKKNNPKLGYLANGKIRWGLLFSGDILSFLTYDPEALHLGGPGGKGVAAMAKGISIVLNGLSASLKVVHSKMELAE